ncbi:hypothetical protein E2C01_049713 [Portunus trituberculatus]|uniref:Uncharacterized protein n=1 Tax=Portunus trituberculatus TaxID=210409 RepID=A0A5B7G6C4_PORTR|nr:hypothetical protein [Portunus trituberculatus]
MVIAKLAKQRGWEHKNEFTRWINTHNSSSVKRECQRHCEADFTAKQTRDWLRSEREAGQCSAVHSLNMKENWLSLFPDSR